jgi:glycosyltransferase involved in cell wall biosynthesis
MAKPMPPLVSVIIPTYNRAWILKEAVDSVLAQHFQDYELIVVDDGSTDDTGFLLADYGRRLIVVRQPNLGVSAARNAGIKEARGQYLAFLDSDDLWLPDKLEVQVAYLAQNSDVQICQTEEIWIRNGVQVNPKRRHRKPSGMIFKRSLELCLVSPSAVMMNRRLLSDVGLFDENLPACEDYDLWLRISCRYPVHLIERPLIVKRGGHADQLSRQPGLDKYRVQSLANLMDAHVLTAWQAQSAINVMRQKCTVYAMGCDKRGRADEARCYRSLARRYERMLQPNQ